MKKFNKYTTLEVRSPKGQHKLIRFRDMVLIESNGNGIKMKVCGITYTHPATMDDFMYNTVSLGLFCRVHNKYIANTDKIIDYDKTTYEIRMKDNCTICFSKDGLSNYLLMMSPAVFVSDIQHKINFKVVEIIPVVIKVIKKITLPLIKKHKRNKETKL